MKAPAHATPYLDAWLEQLRAATDGSGKKTELAEFMAQYKGQPLHTWRVNIPRMLRGDRQPGGDDLLAISAWMDGQRAKTR